MFESSWTVKCRARAAELDLELNSTEKKKLVELLEQQFELNLSIEPASVASVVFGRVASFPRRRQRTHPSPVPRPSPTSASASSGAMVASVGVCEQRRVRLQLPSSLPVRVHRQCRFCPQRPLHGQFSHRDSPPAFASPSSRVEQLPACDFIFRRRFHFSR
ncbi:hypothetical protein IEQ34_005035 [Dendrobium chrysotoxum]|uniref:Uncharacterized protein n=1 Tax=Dendrobium chrysotoxum TaxID=161865 RepID=A0AAV7H901_DENCH|nr:hypothetical protein IEQ34_005035 [Dendrobium chrysotoxum]